MLYRVMRRSNFDSEGPDGEQYFITNSLPKECAEAMAEAANKHMSGPGHPDYYQAVPSNHKLFRFEP